MVLQSTRFAEERPAGSVRALVSLILALLSGGAFLYLTAGPPQLPAEVPHWDQIMRTLAGSDLPPEVVSYFLTTLAWAIWFWIVGSILLRLTVLIEEARNRGSAWARRLRAVSDRITLPVVRRVVDASLFAVVMLNVASRSAPSAAAAPLPAVVEARSADNRSMLVMGGWDPSGPTQSDDGADHHTVQAGDTLWTISERFYGTGREYTRLVEANAGTQMTDGRWFTRAGVIHPGWVLIVPRASLAVDQGVDGHLVYTVEKCDTLSGIAARLMGDEARWPEIFDLNKEAASTPDGQVLTNPDLIWPGLQLRLPGDAQGHDGKAADDAITVEPSPEPAPATNDDIPPTEEVAPDPLASSDSSETPVPQSETPAAAAPVERRPIVVANSPRPATSELPRELIYGGAAAAISAAVGGSVYLARRRFRRSLRDAPVSRSELGYEAEDGFAEGDVARVFVHRVHGAEVDPIARVAAEMLSVLRSEGISEVGLLTAHHGRRDIGLTVDAGLAEQSRIADLAPTIAARLGTGCDVQPTADHDLLIRLAATRLSELILPPAGLQDELPVLLPIGLAQRREPLYASWHETKHALVAGATGVGVDAVLTSLLASLVVRRHPRDLQLWTIGARGTMAPQVLELPHQQRVCTDPEDSEAASQILEAVRQELERRISGRRTSQSALAADVVLVIGELADLLDDSIDLEVVLRDGAAYGIRVLASTSRTEEVSPDRIALFGTRIVMHVDDEEESVQLLGRPDAADLGADGDLLLQIGGRSPILLRGFRVASEHLDQLVDLMAEAYDDDTLVQGSDPDAGQSRPDKTVEEGLAPQGLSANPSTIPDASKADEESHGELDPSEMSASYERSVTVGRSARVKASDPLRSGSELTAEQKTGGPIPAIASEQGQSNSDVPGSTSTLQSEGQAGLVTMLEQRRAPALVQVRCFGVLEVTSGDRELTPEGSGGPRHKAWEILACLASHAERGMPKEKLLNALWPGVGSESASSRLYSNLSILRSLLAEQVPGLPADVVRGDKSSGMYRLDSSLVWSDVQDFLALIHGARKLQPPDQKLAYEQARGLYRGDLLTDMPYKWTNAENEHGYTLWEEYREEYRQLTCRLAQLCSAAGEADKAVLLYRDLLRDEPTLEDVVRQLFRCYQQLGDRNSLIRDERLLREAIRQRYYDPDEPNQDQALYEPELETVEVYREILADLQGEAPSSASPSVQQRHAR